jgi:hypothetical protein
MIAMKSHPQAEHSLGRPWSHCIEPMEEWADYLTKSES